VGAFAYDPGGIQERPSWGSTIWAVLRGYIFALVVLGVPVTVLWYAGVPLIPEAASEPGPWPIEGPWSIAADASLFVVVVSIASLIIHWSAAGTLGRPVSPLVVLAAVALTGYAPFLSYRWVESGVLALLLTVAAVRYVGVDRDHSLQVGRAGLALIVAILAAGTLTATAYALAHPLGLSETGGGFMVDEEHRFVSADLRNGGWGDLRIVSVESDAAPVRGVPWEAERFAGTVIPARGEISISFAERVCPFEAVVRYELAGRAFTQRLVLDHC
jgi:hypothetical protein